MLRSTRELSAGDKLGRYVIVGRVGAGAMGVVYAAFDPQLDRKIALKVVPKAAVADARGLLEAQALAKLAHPNVVAIYDVGERDALLWIAMEFVEGPTLDAWLDERPRSVTEILDVFEAAITGLAAAHAAGLTHCDLKPSNLMVGKDARVRVMDFGLARAERAPGTAESSPPDGAAGPSRRNGMTGGGGAIGTPAYMPAEQHEGQSLDGRADQFSLCVTLWEALYRERPFAGSTVPEITAAIMDGVIRTPSAAATVPAWLRRVCERGLAKDPAARWPSVIALGDALARGRRTLRRRLVGASVISVPVIAGLAWAGHSIHEDRLRLACSEQGEAIRQVWNAQQRAALVASISAVDRSYAASTAARTADWLDTWADAWSEARRDVCVAQRIEAPSNVVLPGRAMQCLDERRVVFEATVGELLEGGEVTALRGVGTAAALPKVNACRDPAYLRQLPAFAGDALDDARQIRATLLAARGAFRRGQYPDAVQAAEQALAAARTADLDALVAEASYVLGAILPRTGDADRARTLLRAAYVEGTRAGALEVATLAATNLLALPGTGTAEATAWADAARTALHGWDADGQSTVAAGLLGNIGNLHLRRGDVDAAEAALLESLEISEHELGAGHPRSLAVRMSVGRVALQRDDVDAALTHHTAAAQGFVETLGEAHPNTGVALSAMSNTLVQARRLDEALETARRAVAVWEVGDGTSLDPLHAGALEGLAKALMAKQQFADALPANRAAQAIYEQTGPDEAVTRTRERSATISGQLAAARAAPPR